MILHLPSSSIQVLTQFVGRANVVGLNVAAPIVFHSHRYLLLDVCEAIPLLALELYVQIYKLKLKFQTFWCRKIKKYVTETCTAY
jgi:hypothetical protein